MSNYSKSLVLGSVLAAATMASSATFADVTANIGVTSNYLWRGVTQSADLSAVSGGLDYSHESGFYAGTWASSLSGSQYEQDLYLGYSGEVSGFSYDVGYIMYMYPIDDTVEADFSEVQATVGYGPVSLYVAKQVGAEASGVKNDGTYVSLNLSGEINKDFGYSLTAGSYTGKDVEATFGDTYTHYAVAISKGDFTFSYEKNNLDNAVIDTWVTAAKDPRVVMSWSKEL